MISIHFVAQMYTSDQSKYFVAPNRSHLYLLQVMRIEQQPSFNIQKQFYYFARLLQFVTGVKVDA